MILIKKYVFKSSTYFCINTNRYKVLYFLWGTLKNIPNCTCHTHKSKHHYQIKLNVIQGIFLVGKLPICHWHGKSKKRQTAKRISFIFWKQFIHPFSLFFIITNTVQNLAEKFTKYTYRGAKLGGAMAPVFFWSQNLFII